VKSDYKNLHYLTQRINNHKIAVCDDEQSFRSILIKIISDYLLYCSHVADITEFSCGEDLLSSTIDFDIIILDHKMTDIDGLETAKRLRKKNITAKIIFITNFPQFVYEAFEVNAFRFLKKPINPSEFYIALTDCFRVLAKNNPIILRRNQKLISVELKDIVYIEANNKHCYISLRNKKMHCSISMVKLCSLIPKKHFIKVNKSFVVNLNNISKYNRKCVFFNSGGSIPIGRKYLASFKYSYMNYARNLDY